MFVLVYNGGSENMNVEVKQIELNLPKFNDNKDNNFDAVAFGKGLGIDPNTCINYGNSSVGCANVIRSTSHALNRARFAPSAAVATACCSYTQDERDVSLQK